MFVGIMFEDNACFDFYSGMIVRDQRSSRENLETVVRLLKVTTLAYLVFSSSEKLIGE